MLDAQHRFPVLQAAFPTRDGRRIEIVVRIGSPKLWFELAPHSPFVAGLVKSQSGSSIRIRIRPRPRRAGVARGGDGIDELCEPTPQPSTYRLTFILTAVRPFPNTSTDAPSRGEMSFQLGKSSVLGEIRGPYCGASGTGG